MLTEKYRSPAEYPVREGMSDYPQRKSWLKCRCQPRLRLTLSQSPSMATPKVDVFCLLSSRIAQALIIGLSIEFKLSMSNFRIRCSRRRSKWSAGTAWLSDLSKESLIKTVCSTICPRNSCVIASLHIQLQRYSHYSTTGLNPAFLRSLLFTCGGRMTFKMHRLKSG